LNLGDKCGATIIDQSFKEWLVEKLGREVVQRIPAAELREGSRIAKQFDAIKRSFNGTPMELLLTLPWEAEINDDPENGIKDGELRITQ
jgi:hypothetical protein